MNPPPVASLLLRLLLPRHLREAIAGDLEEEWRATARPSRLRYWNLTLRSIAACWTSRLSFQSRRTGVPQPKRRGDTLMQSLWQDIRYGWRLMWRNPGFTAGAVATLALGIGANSAIFSLVNVLSLKPLAYHDPTRVAFVLGWDLEEQDLLFNLRLADYIDLQERARSLESIAAYTYVNANLTGGDIPERAQAYRVTANTFSLLGVQAAIGRVLQPDDGREGHEDVVVLGHGLWQRRFGGDPSIVGRRVEVNGRPCEVVGVMPARFEFPVFNFKGDLWMPWPMTDAGRGQAEGGQSTTVVARVRSGVSYAQAQAELDSLMSAFATAHPETNRGLGGRLVRMDRLDEEQAGAALAILPVTVALVLMLACANVANLLLARGISRNRELAVRAAVGASRLRIGRQLLIEGLMLALAGGAAGLVLAMAALEGLRLLLPEMILTTMPHIDELGVDEVTLGFTLVVSFGTSLIFGLLPAWRAARGHFHDGLKESAASGGSQGTRRLRTTLVVSEVALSTVLLVGAGLLVRSYSSLQRVDPGFVPEGVLTMALTLPDYKYPEPPQRLQFYERSLERISALPGVRSAGYVNVLPFSTYDRGTRLVVENAPPPEPGREPSVAYRIASPGYLEALHVPVVEGRSFDARDRAGALRVALVNRALAHRFPGAGSPVGRRVRLGREQDSPWITVVGVVGDVHHSQLTESPEPEIYLPMAQAPASMMMLAVRSEQRPEDLIRAVRTEINAVDPAQPVYHVKTMAELVGDSLLGSSTSAIFMTVFGALALLLAAIGVYGVVAYGMSLRTREFGLRIALGATPRDLLALVLRQGLLMVGLGVAIGAAGALGVSQLMAGVLYGVTPGDPLTYIAVAGILGVMGLVACSLPAWRASRIQPVAALRAD
jgi:putative ABC transport system permease protein